MHRAKQRGDTIIEVMLVVAILGLAFSIAYATANTSVVKARNSQEHAEALQFMDSQVELLRTNLSANTAVATSGHDFCMDTTTHTPPIAVKAVPTPISVCNVGVSNRYALTIKYESYLYPPPTGVKQDIYTIQVNWAGANNLGPQHEKITYKLHAL